MEIREKITRRDDLLFATIHTDPNVSVDFRDEATKWNLKWS